MPEKSRRTRAVKRAATSKRSDQGSDPKLKYRIRRKFPDPPELERGIHPASPSKAARVPKRTKVRAPAALHDEQLAMPFVVPTRTEAQPFLKWAGGKTSLLATLDEFLPAEVERYIEPFLGGGAVFFHLKRCFPHMRAFLRDSNEELINCFRIVRDRTEELMERLDGHAAAFRKGGADCYYEVRGQHHLADALERAARTIFLNKTCFNGLYRVNAKGEFNTPVGSAKNPSLYRRANLLAAAWALSDAELEAKDFRETVEEARRGDFIYFDPPYFPISEYSDFKRYTSGQFREADHVELARAFRVLDQRGCHVVLSNSDHPRIRELYADYPIRVVQAPRMINCKGDRRGDIVELRRPTSFCCLFGERTATSKPTCARSNMRQSWKQCGQTAVTPRWGCFIGKPSKFPAWNGKPRHHSNPSTASSKTRDSSSEFVPVCGRSLKLRTNCRRTSDRSRNLKVTTLTTKVCSWNSATSRSSILLCRSKTARNHSLGNLWVTW